jgi:orotidine-5'-phosphate decarboxylase
MTHPMAKKLRDVMIRKQSNLSLSLDVTNKTEFLHIIDLLGPEICLLKTHIDVIEDFDVDLIHRLQAIAKKHDFLIFEDRKFADIGETVKHQFSKGLYHIADWADMVNAHGVAGPGTIEGLKSVARPGTGLLLLAQMSSKGNLLTPAVSEIMIDWGEQHADFVMGFIAQKRFSSKKDFIYLTPGVHLDKTGDGKDQQYRSPAEAITRDGCDIIIVGRAIYEDENPLAQAKRYRQAGWAALL